MRLSRCISRAAAAFGVQSFKLLLPVSYTIRRVVFPTILMNCTESKLLLPTVFRAVVSALTSFWTNHRAPFKYELGAAAHSLLLQ
jgi:hypothetical protein